MWLCACVYKHVCCSKTLAVCQLVSSFERCYSSLRLRELSHIHRHTNILTYICMCTKQRQHLLVCAQPHNFKWKCFSCAFRLFSIWKRNENENAEYLEIAVFIYFVAFHQLRHSCVANELLYPAVKLKLWK